MNNFTLSAELVFSILTVVGSGIAAALIARLNGKIDQKFSQFEVALMDKLEKKFVSERIVDYKIELATAKLGPICNYPAIRERIHEQLETENNAL